MNLKSVLELKRLWCTKAFLDDWPPRSPAKNKRFGSPICFLCRDWCGEWPEVASIEVRAYVSPSVRCFFIIGTQSDRRVESYWAVITRFTFDTLLLTVEYESPIVCRLATVLLFFSNLPILELAPCVSEGCKSVDGVDAHPSLKRTLLKLFTCSRVYLLYRPFVSASTRRFQKIMQRPDAYNFILTSTYMLHVISRWYTSDFNVVTMNF